MTSKAVGSNRMFRDNRSPDQLATTAAFVLLCSVLFSVLVLLVEVR